MNFFVSELLIFLYIGAGLCYSLDGAFWH